MPRPAPRVPPATRAMRSIRSIVNDCSVTLQAHGATPDRLRRDPARGHGARDRRGGPPGADARPGRRELRPLRRRGGPALRLEAGAAPRAGAPGRRPPASAGGRLALRPARRGPPRPGRPGGHLPGAGPPRGLPPDRSGRPGVRRARPPAGAGDARGPRAPARGRRGDGRARGRDRHRGPRRGRRGDLPRRADRLGAAGRGRARAVAAPPAGGGARTASHSDRGARICPVIFSSRAEYGVRLMVELGRQRPETPISLKALAEAEGLPLAYLEQVVARLKRAGLVESARGAHGGYWLARPAEQITMDEVVQALEGAIAPMECFLGEPTERVLCSHVGAS